jgi:hypothetical protein
MKNDDPDTRLAELEEKVGQLERRANDFALKSQILVDLSSPSFETGIDRFFAEPEFWENTYDSSQADCSRRCSADYRSASEACAALADPDERKRCQETADQAVAACHANCANL